MAKQNLNIKGKECHLCAYISFTLFNLGTVKMLDILLMAINKKIFSLYTSGGKNTYFCHRP